MSRWQFLPLLPYQEALEQQDLWAQIQDKGRISQTIKAPPGQWAGPATQPSPRLLAWRRLGLQVASLGEGAVWEGRYI